ncbi:MAG: peptidyl-prolyl cis-trans isomerase [Armatimonadetes bacterium]|nr:peptidyl-prolyl cis-trans isomerase [Armatimonadota bacterium]
MARTRLLYLLLLLGLVVLGSGCTGADEHETAYDTGAGNEAPAINNAPAAPTDSGQPNPKKTASGPIPVTIQTSMGTIEAELWPDKAPTTVENFVRYAREGHYNGTIFHRVISDFMIQGGGFTATLREKPTHDPIQNEAGNGLENKRGTLAMARTSDPDSATSQFFISLKHNEMLDRQHAADGVGYAVFGKVTRGMGVVDRIARVETASAPNGMDDVPVKPVVIQSVKAHESVAQRKPS